jgi:hypothetical protein
MIMAKSIFETLDSLQTETSVPAIGKNVEHSLPRSLFPVAETFESSDKLLAWANENNFTHALLQAGIQKGLIDCRAKFKACKKDETWTPELGQEQVDSMTWEIVQRPKENNIAKIKGQAELDAGIKLANAMKGANVADAIILASLTPVYGENIAKMILDSIE